MCDMRNPRLCKSIVSQVVAGHSIRSRLWRAALEVLLGIIVRGSTGNVDAGNALLLDVMPRIQAGPAVVRAAVFFFTVLVNISAHVGFAAKYWHVVEVIVLSVISDVVQAARAESSESWSFEPNLVGTRGTAETYPPRTQLHARNLGESIQILLCTRAPQNPFLEAWPSSMV